uniref:Uncharacterized protein n=1 Tax=Arundo donax TaxID=35708 RepID=A0A0A9FRZ9_ARUDO
MHRFISSWNSKQLDPFERTFGTHVCLSKQIYMYGIVYHFLMVISSFICTFRF